MEDVLREIEGGNEDSIRESLRIFNEKNSSNYKLREPLTVRKNFCSAMLSQFSNLTWCPDTVVLALGALKIFTREQEGSSQLIFPSGLTLLIHLAGLNVDFVEMKEFFGSDGGIDGDQVNVMVGAVKCLCNLVLKNHPLANTVSELGCLRSLRTRLALNSSMPMPHDILFFDLRFMFLITACGPDQRAKLRDELDGLSMLVTLLDTVLFGPVPERTKEGLKSIAVKEGEESIPAAAAVKEGEESIPAAAAVKEGEESIPAAAAVKEGEESIPAEVKEGEESKPAAAKEGEESEEKEGEESKPAAAKEGEEFVTKKGEDPNPAATQLQVKEDTSEETQFADGKGTTESRIAEDGSRVEGGESKSTDEEEEVKPKRYQSSLRIRKDCFVLPCAMTDEMCAVLSESLKIIFSQTVNWKLEKQYDDEEMDLFFQLSHLIRIMICSTPLTQNKTAFQTLNHCYEVMMNIPQQCHPCFLLPHGETITLKLQELYPTLYSDQPETLYNPYLDEVYEDQNMAVAVYLLNYLNLRINIEDKIDQHGLSIVLGTMSLLSRGNRVFRRYFKSQVLPPLLEVKSRPEAETSLKGRLVKLMTAGAHDCQDMVAEFLFVLCKESASRLVKHTGYGNAAGLLMSHGLLGGGRSQNEADYSSDSGSSDTEEYKQTKDSVDPVTGGPSKTKKESPLDHMTPAELEDEAAKLEELFSRLERQGDFKLVPLDKNNQPMKFPKSKPEEESPNSSDADN